ncbi:DMT family transporter [Ideonella paludis]|uniref:EamA family transporter n=1 Tax=Ideonella paludis TaxID=1233411 RepID=A0ABS5DUA0_9BURK|nr:DMT family transporter [Ideonella paludis]MBQ0934717.1 EamA family transporter [Ideonella paludis]
MALVGSYVGLSKVLVAIFPIFLLAWLRFGIAAVAMSGWLRRTTQEPPLGPKEKGLLFLESFLGNFLFSICMLYGVAATSAVSAGVMMAGIPAMVALLSWLFLGERIRPMVLAGIALAVCGMSLLALARPSAAPEHPSTSSIGPLWGHVLLLGAVFCEACYVVIGKRLTAQVSPKRISALINLWGLALVTPLGLWQASQFDFSTVALPSWGLLLFYALAASVVTVWLWMIGLQKVPAQRAGVFSVLLPVSACAVGVFFLSEPLGLMQGLALGLALLGLLLATWPSEA